MPDLERIRHYEALLDRAGPAVEKLLAALRDYAEAKPLVEALREYYRSDWKEDAAMDEAGLLPRISSGAYCPRTPFLTFWPGTRPFKK